jgi:ABC-type amino acid transport substrate-binding protein
MGIDARRVMVLAPALLCVALVVSTQAAERAPLRVVSTGPINAFDRELLSIFAKMHGRNLVFATPQPAGAPAAAVVGGDADLLVGLTPGGQIPPLLAATREVFPTRLVAVTRRPKPACEFIEALRSKRLGVVRDSRARAAVQAAKISGVVLSEYSSPDEAAAALRAGTVAALLIELPQALLARRDDAALELGVFVGLHSSVEYAVRGNDQDLLRGLNAFLEKICATPTWRFIVDRHFGSGALDALARARLLE